MFFFGQARLLDLNRMVGEVMALGYVSEARVDLIVLQGLILWSRLPASLTAFISSVLLWKCLLRPTRLILEAALRTGSHDVGHLLLGCSDVMLAPSL